MSDLENNTDLKILNLGCGPNTHPSMMNIDYSIQARLAKKPSLVWIGKRLGFINNERVRFLAGYSEDIILHNLAKGIPVEDSSVDVIYHSHLLEHLTKNDAADFIKACFTKLGSGGKIRIVVPDLAVFCDEYLAALNNDIDRCVDGVPNANLELATYKLLQQLVVTETDGSMKMSGFRRVLENLLLGDRRKRGDLHLWMYDRISLRRLLEEVGFINVMQVDHKRSSIDGWSDFGLDANPDSTPYKKDSIYFEGEKP